MKRGGGRWRTAGVGDVQVQSRINPKSERGSRVQKSSGAQLYNDGWRSSRIQDVRRRGLIIHKADDIGGAGKILGRKNKQQIIDLEQSLT